MEDTEQDDKNSKREDNKGQDDGIGRTIGFRRWREGEKERMRCKT